MNNCRIVESAVNFIGCGKHFSMAGFLSWLWDTAQKYGWGMWSDGVGFIEELRQPECKGMLDAALRLFMNYAAQILEVAWWQVSKTLTFYLCSLGSDLRQSC